MKENERTDIAKVDFVLGSLTEKQRRRFVMYLRGYKLAQIARTEQVCRKAIRKSLTQTQNKIKKRFGNDWIF